MKKLCLIIAILLFFSSCGDIPPYKESTSILSKPTVTATAGNTQITVSWTAVSGATSYNIYWSTNSGAEKSGTKIAGATSPYTITGLANSTTVYTWVTAVNPNGESDLSSVVSAAPTSGTTTGDTITTTMGSTISIGVGQQKTLSVTDAPSGWLVASANAGVATVATTKIVRGISQGTTYFNIYTSSMSYVGQITVNVTSSVSGTLASLSSSSFFVTTNVAKQTNGIAASYTVACTDNSGNAVSGVTATSANPSAATVANGSGTGQFVVTAQTVATDTNVTITFTQGSVSLTAVAVVLSGITTAFSSDTYTVALWRFNESSGTTVIDSAGSNTGTTTGTSIVTGNFGNARSFNGTSDYITVPDHSSLKGLSQITIEAWVYPSSFDLGCWNGTEDIVSKGDATNSISEKSYSLKIYRNSNSGCGDASSFNYVYFGFNIPGFGVTSAALLPTYSPNAWYYVAGTYDGNRLRIYVNGSLGGDAINISITGIGNNTRNLFINHHIWDNGTASLQRMGGKIDEIRISNIARTATEIQNHYTSVQ